jgi:hypothetical protein
MGGHIIDQEERLDPRCRLGAASSSGQDASTVACRPPGLPGRAPGAAAVCPAARGGAAAPEAARHACAARTCHQHPSVPLPGTSPCALAAAQPHAWRGSDLGAVPFTRCIGNSAPASSW